MTRNRFILAASILVVVVVLIAFVFGSDIQWDGTATVGIQCTVVDTTGKPIPNTTITMIVDDFSGNPPAPVMQVTSDRSGKATLNHTFRSSGTSGRIFSKWMVGTNGTTLHCEADGFIDADIALQQLHGFGVDAQPPATIEIPIKLELNK